MSETLESAASGPEPGAKSSDVVIFLDVDNTLLDNDRIIADLHDHLEKLFGSTADRYWTIFEQLRDELGYVNYLGALQRYRAELDHAGEADHQLLGISGFLIDYPFADRLYPHALDVVKRLGEFGTTVILTDGDVVFQPRKIHQAGLWDAVDGRVLIYVHKEEMLDNMRAHFPARQYVMVDDKQRILTAMKEGMGDSLVTVFPRQGHYALDPENVARYPAADCTIDSIGDLLSVDVGALLHPVTKEKS